MPIKYIHAVVIGFLFFACSKKNTDNGTNDPGPGSGAVNNPVPAISAQLEKVDSLTNFSALFKNISLSATDYAEGITVLAPVNHAMVNPFDPGLLKDFIIKGVVPASDLTNNKKLFSVSGREVDITVQSGNTYANGVMISTRPVAKADGYVSYAMAGFYVVNAVVSFDDPHKNEYYVEYSENGVAKSLSGRRIGTWPFFSSNSYPAPVGGTCSFPSYNSYSSGPMEALLAFVVDHPFWLQINRANFASLPGIGDYNISQSTYNATAQKNSGNCNLVINGARFGCDPGFSDAYVHVRITEVKVDQDLGIEKRGYYKGEFDAILYYTSTGGSAPEKRIISGGRFMAPMGGNETAALNGTAPPLMDRLAILTTGAWALRPFVEEQLKDPNSDYSTCDLDDYMIFGKDGTVSINEGPIICGRNEGNIDPGTGDWSFKDNQTTLHIFGEDAPITTFSDSLIVFGALKLTHIK